MKEGRGLNSSCISIVTIDIVSLTNSKRLLDTDLCNLQISTY